VSVTGELQQIVNSIPKHQYREKEKGKAKKNRASQQQSLDGLQIRPHEILLRISELFKLVIRFNAY
jgi:hypothetical protein